MVSPELLNLFYEEPDRDRWIRWDRYPRALIRRLVRGHPQPGGVMRWFLNLCAGLDRLGVKYRVNDYRSLRKTSQGWAHVIGKSHVVGKIPPGHPVIYGPGVPSHPADSKFLETCDIRLLLVSCEWLKTMYERGLPRPIRIAVWPAGIDTDRWNPLHTGDKIARRSAAKMKTTDFLIYDKVRWDHDQYEVSLLQPIRSELEKRGLSFSEIRYGFYEEKDFYMLLQQCRAMIFLCEHETQGFAYLQALSSGVPILAWDRGGYWQDPEFYPQRVRFEPVTSVPYWDGRCGVKFKQALAFPGALEAFWSEIQLGRFSPRDYILENLTLERCAKEYVRLAEGCSQ
jgi:hypothetical protein